MSKRKSLFALTLFVSTAFILYVLYANFVHDPGASGFLSHKTGLKRPIQVPVWLSVMKIHVVFACIAMLSGIVNFSSRIRVQRRTFHRINGYIYLISVLIVVITSGYMAPYATGGKAVGIAFNALNIIWPCMTVAALVKIKKKQADRHRKWMIRSYAFCFTNLFIHLIASVFHRGLGLAYPASYTIGVYSAIPLLFVLAEAVIRIPSAESKA